MYTETNVSETPTDIFNEHELLQQYEHATTGQRFLNWLIDNIVMRVGLSWLTGLAVGHLLAAIAPDFYLDMIYSEGFSYYAVLYLIGFFNYVVYYTFCEKAFNGYTLGKLITGTRAIREDGTELTFKDALLRSLSRIVPFEVFSGFGVPWHDSWTNTTVIKTR